MKKVPFNVSVGCEDEFCTPEKLSLDFCVALSYPEETISFHYTNMDGHALLSASDGLPLIENTIYSTDDDVFEGACYSEPNPELSFYFDCQILTGKKATIIFSFENSQEEKVQLMVKIDRQNIEQQYID